MPTYCTFLSAYPLSRRNLLLKYRDFVCQYFVVGSLSAVGVSVFGCSQSSGDMQRHANADAVYIRDVLAFPRYHVVPCCLRNCCSVSGLVEQVGGKRKVGYPHPVVLVGAYYSYASLELDPVDVFHKIFVLELLFVFLPHILCALCRLIAK